MGGSTGETGGELAGIVWEEMGLMGVGVQGAGRRAGRRPGGGAADAGEARVFRRSRNGLRPVGGGFWLLGKGSGGGGLGKGREPGMVQKRGGAQGAGRRPGGEAADTGGARVFRRSRNGLRPVGGAAKPCPAWEKG